jgi:hypothetical protein
VNDLIYGVYEIEGNVGGRRAILDTADVLRERLGGKGQRLDEMLDLMRRGESIEGFTARMMEESLEAGNTIHFDIGYIKETLPQMIEGAGDYGQTITAFELRYLKENWARFKDHVKFYQGSAEVAAPW